MRILKEDLKKGFVHIKIEQPEDLWYLSHIIAVGDSVKGTTERKIKIGGEDARNQKVVRKKMTLTLSVEKVDYLETLRVLGLITNGPDDVARGEHHSFNVTEGDDITITKHSWATWEKDKLKEASSGPKERILVVLFDREEALFALLTTKGHKVLSKLKGNVQRKGSDETILSNFWKTIADQLTEYNTRYSTKSIIAASPAFWKDYLKKALNEELSKKTIYSTVSEVDEAGLAEVVKRPELHAALAKDRSAKESYEMSLLLAGLAHDKCAYGIEEVEKKANDGALQNVLVSESFLKKVREEGSYERLDSILKTAESGNAQILIITTDDIKKQLDGLGGIAGISRW